METDSDSKRDSYKSGPHYIQESDGLRVGMRLNTLSPRAELSRTLTSARKKAKSGSAVIRAKDLVVVSIK